MAFSDWSEGLFGAVGTIGGSVFGAGQTDNTTYVAPPAPVKDNTTIYIVVGVSVAVIMVAVAIVINNKK